MAQTRVHQYLSKFTGGILLPTGAGAGKFLVSDAEGNASWESAKTRIIAHSWTVQGEVKNETFPGFYVKLGTNEEQKLVACRYRLASGTSIKVEVQRNAAEAAGFAGLEVKSSEAKSTEPTAIKLEGNDFINIITSSGSGTPKGLTFTLFVEHL